MTVRYYHRVLESDVPDFIAAGWHDEGVRDHPPSVAEPVALLSFDGEQPPSPEVPRGV